MPCGDLKKLVTLWRPLQANPEVGAKEFVPDCTNGFPKYPLKSLKPLFIGERRLEEASRFKNIFIGSTEGHYPIKVQSPMALPVLFWP